MRLAWLLSSCAIGYAVTGCGGPSDSGKLSGDTPTSDAGDPSAVRVLECAWLTGSDNCFRAPLTAAAQNCAIPGPDGVLSADVAFSSRPLPERRRLHRIRRRRPSRSPVPTAQFTPDPSPA
jgi:hypothetical protein